MVSEPRSQAARPGSAVRGRLVGGISEAQDGNYVYGVSNLHLEGGDAPTWIIEIDQGFESWKVTRRQ